MQIKSTYMYWVLTICMALYEVSLLKTKQFHLNFSFSFRVCDDLGKKELHWISQIYLLETKMNIWCGWGCQNTQKQINKLTKKILGALLYLIKSFQNHNALMSLSKILNSVISKLFELSLNPWNFAGPSRGQRPVCSQIGTSLPPACSGGDGVYLNKNNRGRGAFSCDLSGPSWG